MECRDGKIIFSAKRNGSEVTLASLLPLSEEEVNELAREAFLSRIEEHPEDGYFEDAADTIRAKTDFLSQSYLTQEGVVFYAQPYEIGPYASGFIEVTVTMGRAGTVSLHAMEQRNLLHGLLLPSAARILAC